MSIDDLQAKLAYGRPAGSDADPSTNESVISFDPTLRAFLIELLEVVEESIGAGGGDSQTLLGPFAVAHDTPDIESQAGLVELAAGTMVVRTWLRVTIAFDVAFSIGAGGAGALSNGDWWTAANYAFAGLQADSGAWSEETLAANSVVGLLNDGWLVASAPGVSQGAGFVYALVCAP